MHKNTYTYDQGGRRLKKIVDDGTTTLTTRYPFADYEVTTSGSTKTTVKADTQHVATIEDDGTSQVIYFHHDDHLGGANVVTSVVGAEVQVIDYYPFGSVRVDDQSASYDSTQKFTGHELDDSTGLYYTQARYYDSEIGRFISQDPLQIKPAELLKLFGWNPQAQNYYSYSLNNPIILKDPEGKYPVLSEVTDVGSNSFVLGISAIFENSGFTPKETLRLTESVYKEGSKDRYVFTETSGWIDLKHFFSAASGADKFGYSLTIEAGKLLEFAQKLTNHPSAYSFEDLTSNMLGAYFGGVYLPEKLKENSTLTEALESFFKDIGTASKEDALKFYNKVNVEGYGEWSLPEGYTKENDHPKSQESSTTKNELDKTFNR